MFRIGGSRKFHNILKISVWVVLRSRYVQVLQYLLLFARFARANLHTLHMHFMHRRRENAKVRFT